MQQQLMLRRIPYTAKVVLAAIASPGAGMGSGSMESVDHSTLLSMQR